MQLPMTWDEIKMRARDGAGRQILADLNGVDYKTFCKWLEQQESIHGEKIVFNKPKNDNRLKSSSNEKQEPKQEVKPEPAETKSDLDDDILTELCRICAEHEKNYELAAAGIKTLEIQMEEERKIIQHLKTMMGGKT